MGSCCYRVENHCRDSFENRRYKKVKSLSDCFTHRDIPHRSKTPTEHFQLEGDAEYSTCPTLPELCNLVVRLNHKWEKLHHEYVSHSMSVGSISSSSTLGKRDRQSKSSDQNKQSKSSDKDGDNPLPMANRFYRTRRTHLRMVSYIDSVVINLSVICNCTIVLLSRHEYSNER
jgi:hypothetical protein